jgi:threonine dehydrogenase-like Zn-dependent dehydrogenase
MPIVKVTSCAICGSDPHLFAGSVADSGCVNGDLALGHVIQGCPHFTR